MTAITCGGCPSTWTAPGAAHCAAQGCHQTFTSVGLFDRHRSPVGAHGSCREPLAIGLEFRDGMWRGPAMTDEQKAARFGGGGATP